MATNILIPHERIVARIRTVAKEIAHDYTGHHVLLLTVLNGAMPTVTYLMTALWEEGLRDAELGTVKISSYTTGTTQKTPIMKKEPSADLKNRHILVVEDIIDSGNTMKFLYNYLKTKETASIKTFTLLSKPSRRLVPFEADYTGFEIEDVWVEGFGLDSDQKNRGCPDIITRNS